MRAGPLIVIFAAAAVCAAAGGLGCASGPATTRMTLDDVDAMTNEMASDLRANLLAGRTAQSPPMLVAITRVENRSRHLMDRAEQWAIMEKIAKSLPITTLASHMNVRFVVERELAEAAQERGTIDRGAFKNRDVTHVMRGVFDSPSRQTAEDRTDAYLCRFSLLDLSSGEEVWSASFDFKRTATGKSFD